MDYEEGRRENYVKYRFPPAAGYSISLPSDYHDLNVNYKGQDPSYQLRNTASYLQDHSHKSKPKMSSRKSLSLLQIILLNAVVCGVEICACAGFTYIPPMLLKTGYTEENMSIILGMGPLLGFFCVPLIGRLSDNCKSQYGRRRPFIVGLSVFLLFSLVVIPYGDVFSLLMVGPGALSKSVTVVLLTLGVVLLDFTTQACLTPCEALLCDASRDTDQHERVFMVYSQMISLGGFLGYLITALDWNATALGGIIGGQERAVFTLLVFLFGFMLCATILVAQEEPHYSELATEQEQMEEYTEEVITPSLTMGNGTTLESGYESSGSEDSSTINHSPIRARKNRTSTKHRAKGLQPILLLFYPIVYILKRFRIISCVSICGKVIFSAVYERLPESAQNLMDIPIVLKKLATANFFSWTAIMGFNLFFTDFVGQAVYEGNPNAEENSYLRSRYDEGVRMGSWGLLLHCITSAGYAFFVEKLVEKYGIRRTYLSGMIIFSLAMLGMVMSKAIIVVNIMAALTGFAYATLTTVPFILVTKYHAEKEVFFGIGNSSTSNKETTVRGIGTDMATLDSAYFLSQVILSAVMGYVVHVTGTVLSYMVTAGFMGLLSCFFIQQIIVCKEDIYPRKRHIEKHKVLQI